VLRIRAAQIEAILLGNRTTLIADLEAFLARCCPHVVRAYPRPYLRWVIGDGLDIALRMGLDDVHVLRVFTRLRWDIAPGFYKQPAIAAVLGDVALAPAERLARLATDEFAAAWDEARRFDSPAEWRARFWQDES
jgi:hypothetical protein